jgi:hypothetical protein
MARFDRIVSDEIVAFYKCGLATGSGFAGIFEDLWGGGRSVAIRKVDFALVVFAAGLVNVNFVIKLNQPLFIARFENSQRTFQGALWRS